MKPIQEAVRGAGISALIGLGSAAHKITDGKKPQHLFLRNVEHKYIGTSVKIVKETNDSTYIAKYNPDGTICDDFKVLLATDIHFDKDNALGKKAFTYLCKHIEEEKPDLVIFTGDIILSDYQQVDSVQLAKLMEEMGIYWAIVFGNHEARDEKEFHKYFMLKNVVKFDHCLSKFGPKDLFGYGNFFINIMGSKNNILKSFAFFDSGRNITEKHRKAHNVPDDIKGYDFIKKGQIEWYKSHIRALNRAYGETKSMLFMHIPIPEYAEVMNFDPEEKPIPTGVPSGKGEIIYGSMHEGVGCSEFNSGLFDVAKEMGGEAFFAGHDHINDYVALYEGIYLVYVQMGGYEEYDLGSRYGVPENELMQGVTVMNIKNDGSFDFERRFNRDFGENV